ncbi:hypothetical protein [Barnesiella intestinihominis]|uniref:hypothetical protein n=1 Tax=Barnesiella intestinihominis TaxID=487174 RepID=UPI0026665D1A|nr:hypothetical protein [Barnesiella intestinihominis]
MKDYEIQSIVSLLERAAKSLEKSDDYRHKELARLMRNKVRQINKKYNGQKRDFK